MATTQKGIYYPDDYTAVADVPEDMKKQAESVDTALDTKVDKEEGKGLSTYNFGPVAKTRLDALWREKPITDTDIARLKATLPTTGEETGENITLSKTAELEFIQPPLPRGNSEQVTSILPTGYTQLDYIESTGTQYIDTGITADNTVEFDVTFNTSNDLDNSAYGCIFGSRQASATKELQVTTFSTSGFQGIFRFGDGTYNAYLTRLQKINVKLENNKYYVDSIEKQTVNNIFTNNYNIYIFALNQANIATQHGTLKLYKFKLWKNGSLVRNYIPCKNANNEVGLYDLVTKTFFGNNGTGTFTAGNTVTIPNPDFEIPIQNVTGDVEVLVQNKNILRFEDKEQTSKNGVTYSIQNGKVVLNGTATAGMDLFIINSNDIKLSQGQSVTQSVNIESGSVTGTAYLETLTYYDNTLHYTDLRGNQTFTPTKDTVLRGTELFIANGTVFNNYTIKPMVQYGTTATTYTPHQEQTFTFPLGNQRMYLGDYLADDGIHHVRKQVTLGDLNWNIRSEYDGDTENYTLFQQTNYNTRLYTNIKYCTHLPIVSANPSPAYNCIRLVNSVGYGINILINKNIASTALELKTWLTEQNVIAEIELAEEEITPYTTEQQQAYDEIKQAISYEEQTNISGSSDESNPLFNVEAYQSTKLILQEISNAVVALGGV